MVKETPYFLLSCLSFAVVFFFGGGEVVEGGNKGGTKVESNILSKWRYNTHLSRHPPLAFHAE